MQLGTSSTFRQLRECGKQVETKRRGKWKRSVEFQMLVGEMSSLGFGWRRLGPRLLHSIQ